jgi:TM2 domain-containing membrane protein YozV
MNPKIYYVWWSIVNFHPKTTHFSMDAQKVDMYMMANAKFFESHQVPAIRERLLQIDDSNWATLSTVTLKDPTTSLIVSILAGSLGIDRFMIGDTGLGVGKLLTCGGFGIWAIVDWFLIQGATREKNMQKIAPFL